MKVETTPLVDLPFLPFLFLMVAFVPPLGSLLSWAVCRLAGVPVKEVKFFLGPSLGTFQMLGATVVIGCIPAGSSVQFDVPVFERKPPLLRLALLLLLPVALLAGAVLLLGPEPALRHFTTGFSQLFDGVLHPLSAAQELIARLEAVHAASVSTAAGVLLAKAASCQVFPVFHMLPMQCLCCLVGPVREGSLLDKVRLFNGIIAVLAFILWVVAVFTYAWRALV